MSGAAEKYTEHLKAGNKKKQEHSTWVQIEREHFLRAL